MVNFLALDKDDCDHIAWEALQIAMCGINEGQFIDIDYTSFLERINKMERNQYSLFCLSLQYITAEYLSIWEYLFHMICDAHDDPKWCNVEIDLLLLLRSVTVDSRRKKNITSLLYTRSYVSYICLFSFHN